MGVFSEFHDAGRTSSAVCFDNIGILCVIGILVVNVLLEGVAVRHIQVALDKFDFRTRQDVAKLDDIVRGNLGDRAVDGGREGHFFFLFVCKRRVIRNAGAFEFLCGNVPSAVVALRILHVVAVHVCGCAVDVLVKFGLEVQAELEGGIVVCAGNGRFAVFLEKFLADRENAERILVHVVSVSDAGAILGCRVSNAEVFSVFNCGRSSFDLLAVYVNRCVDVGIDAALDDPVLLHLFREVDVAGLAGLQEEYIIVGLSGNFDAGLIGDRRLHAFVEDVVFVPRGIVCNSVCKIIFFFVTAFERVNDLVGELRENRFHGLDISEFLAELHVAGLDRSQVESHVQVRCASASLEVEDLHRVARVILEDVLAGFILPEDLGDLRVCICI